MPMYGGGIASEYARSGKPFSWWCAPRASASIRSQSAAMAAETTLRSGCVGRIEWSQDGVTYEAREASLADVRRHACALARGYLDPRSAALMGHERPFDAARGVA